MNVCMSVPVGTCSVGTCIFKYRIAGNLLRVNIFTDVQF